MVKESEDGKQMLVKWRGFSAPTWQLVTAMPQAILDLWYESVRLGNRQDMGGRQASGGEKRMYTFKGTDVVINHQDEEFVESGARQLASDIIDGLKTRFPDMTGSVLSAFDIFHVDSIPAQALHGHWKGWNVYGKDELDILINHYSEYKDGQLVRLVVTAECHAQWRQVRNLMKEAHRQKQSTDDFWEEYLMKPSPRSKEICGIIFGFGSVLCTL